MLFYVGQYQFIMDVQILENIFQKDSYYEVNINEEDCMKK